MKCHRSTDQGCIKKINLPQEMRCHYVNSMRLKLPVFNFRSALDTEVITKVVTMCQTPQVVRNKPQRYLYYLSMIINSHLLSTKQSLSED